MVVSFIGGGNKGNNKITELRTILQRENKTHKYINRQISQQPENCENCNETEVPGENRGHAANH